MGLAGTKMLLPCAVFQSLISAVFERAGAAAGGVHPLCFFNVLAAAAVEAW